jgi:hypothetical protein
MQQQAFARAFDVLLVTDLSRLSRNQGDLLKLIERMRFRRVRVLGVQDAFDSSARIARMRFLRHHRGRVSGDDSRSDVLRAANARAEQGGHGRAALWLRH